MCIDKTGCATISLSLKIIQKKKKILRHSRHLVFTEVLSGENLESDGSSSHRHMHVYTETKSLLTAEKSNFPGPLKKPAIQNLKVNPELALLNLEQST